MAILTGYVLLGSLAILLATITVTVTYIKWSFGYWKRRGVEGPIPKLPFGNAGPLLQQKDCFGEHQRKIYEEYKKKNLKYCGYYFFTKPILILIDLNVIRDIMTRDFQHFTDRGNYVNEEVDPLSGHLFSLKGRKWKNLRQKLTPTFTSGKLKMMFQTLVDCSDDLIVLMDKSSERNQPVDIKDVVARFITDIIGSCIFGLECNSLRDPDAEFRKYGKRFFDVDTVQALKNFFGLGFPGVLGFFKIPALRKDISDFFMKAAEDTVKYRESNNVIRKDFMHLLIQMKNNVKISGGEEVGKLQSAANGTAKEIEVGKTFTLSELAAQVLLFFLAGFETSSITLTFCIYELIQNPEIQEKLREEVNEVLEKHDGDITYDSMMEMTYMSKCINETLRKYPPAPILTRDCTQTYKMPGSDLTIEKDTRIFIPLLGIQRDPEFYPDPEKFDPERFSPENKAKRHSCAWLPFGEGPRACIGKRFGVMQTKVALAVLLKNYKFTLNPKTKIPLEYNVKSILLSVQGGVWLNAEKI